MQNIYRLSDFSPRHRGSVSPTEDEVLLTSIAGGDKAAMRALFERHRVRIYRFVLRIVRDRCEAEEVVSEVFFQVWRRAGMFRGQSQVSTWLLAIARNIALSALRRQPKEIMDDAVAMSIIDPAGDPENTAQVKDRSKLLQLCLARLPPRERAAIDLVYYHHKSISEISQICGAPEGTIKSRLFTARKRLSVLLRANGVESSRAC